MKVACSYCGKKWKKNMPRFKVIETGEWDSSFYLACPKCEDKQ